MPRCTKCEFAYREDELMCGELCWDCAEKVLEDMHGKLVELQSDADDMLAELRAAQVKWLDDMYDYSAGMCASDLQYILEGYTKQGDE